MRTQLLTVQQAADALSISAWTLRKWLATKPPKLEFIRLGRRVAIAEDALQRFIDLGRVGGQDGGR
jgi:excisionase family DNA binding protein